MLAAVWLVLKCLLILLAGSLGLLLAALLLPVTLELTYEERRFRVAVGALGLRWRLYPAREKAPHPKQKKEKAKKKKPAKRGNSPAAKPKPKNAAQGFQVGVDTVWGLVRTAGTAMSRIFGGLKVHGVRVRLPIHGQDAADTAQRYGQACAWLHSALAVLQNFLDLRIQELALVPDFTGEKQGTELFSCKITGRLIIMVIAGVRALIQLKQEGVF